MKPDDIEDLLTRYYEGVTSEAEEKELFLQLAACPEPEIPVGLE